MALENVAKRTIYIPLLNEGTVVARPALAAQVDKRTFFVLLTRDYDPQVEQWEFPPGCIVRCEKEVRGGKEVLVAHARIEPDGLGLN